MKKLNLETIRVVRGGCWVNSMSVLCAVYCNVNNPSNQYKGIGSLLSPRFVRGKR